MPPKGEIKTLHLYGFTTENRPDHNRTVYAKVTLPTRLPRKEAIAKAVEMIPKFHLIEAVTTRQFRKRDGVSRGLWNNRVKVMFHHGAG